MILNNGYEIPSIGLGTWGGFDTPILTTDQILDAIKVGYRLIDTATRYENEREIGAAIQKAIDAGLVTREELFVTTKVWNDEQGYEKTLKAFETSLEKLGLEYVDLYLIHWPKDYEQVLDTYRALEHLVNIGKVRSIGVSNFMIHHLEHLLPFVDIMPVVNQVECHIELQNHRLREFCDTYDILLEAYSPLMSFERERMLQSTVLEDIAKKHDATIAQIALAYIRSMHTIALPKSKSLTRLKENLESLTITLDQEDLTKIRALNTGHRMFADPDNFDE